MAPVHQVVVQLLLIALWLVCVRFRHPCAGRQRGGEALEAACAGRSILRSALPPDQGYPQCRPGPEPLPDLAIPLPTQQTFALSRASGNSFQPTRRRRDDPTHPCCQAQAIGALRMLGTLDCAPNRLPRKRFHRWNSSPCCWMTNWNGASKTV